MKLKNEIKNNKNNYNDCYWVIIIVSYYTELACVYIFCVI